MAASKKSLYKPVDIEKSIVTPRQIQPLPSPTPHPPLSQSLSLSDGETTLLMEDITLNQLSFKKTNNTENNSIISTRVTENNDSSNIHSQVPVSVIKLPSPVRVVRHTPPLPSFPPSGDDRRFSSNFVSPPFTISPPSLPIKEEEEEKETFESYVPQNTKVEKRRKEQEENKVKGHLNKDDLSCKDKENESIKHIKNSNKSENDNIHVPSSHPTDKHSTVDTDIRKNKKKKASSRVVSSRYMEPKREHQAPPSSLSLSQSTRIGKLNQSKLNTTYKDLSFHPSQAFTSTPAVKKPHPPSHVIPTGRDKTNKSVTQNLPATSSTAVKKSGGVLIDPTSIQSLQYVRLLQLTYLNVKAQKVKEEQEKAANSQLYQLWDACNEKSQEVAELKRELEYKRKMKEMDSSIESQLCGLEELNNKLLTVKPHHNTLSNATDTTLHELPTKHIDTSDSQSDLIIAMTEANTISSLIASKIKHITPQVSTIANNVQSLAEIVEKEQKILQKVETHLDTLTKEQVHETSLYHEKQLQFQPEAIVAPI